MQQQHTGDRRKRLAGQVGHSLVRPDFLSDDGGWGGCVCVCVCGLVWGCLCAGACRMTRGGDFRAQILDGSEPGRPFLHSSIKIGLMQCLKNEISEFCRCVSASITRIGCMLTNALPRLRCALRQ